MKLNWGKSIAIVYGVFVVAMLGAVIKSTTYDLNMVKKDYYADDLAYQEHYNKRENARYLHDDFKVAYDNAAQTITIQFPLNMPDPSGKITLFHPAKAQDDKAIDIHVNAQKQVVIPTAHFPYGRWQVQCDWQSGGKGFYKEENVFISNNP